MADTLRGRKADLLYPFPKRHPSGRVGEARRCSMPGCITKLSVYNPSDSCYVHAEPRIMSTRVDSRAKGWG